MISIFGHKPKIPKKNPQPPPPNVYAEVVFVSPNDLQDQRACTTGWCVQKMIGGYILIMHKQVSCIMDDLQSKLSSLTIHSNSKQDIIRRFRDHVKGKPIVTGGHAKHCGKEGHWLEKAMGLAPNAKNAPDIGGYEMKKNSKKISFGDYSAHEYLFSKDRPTLVQYNNDDFSCTRVEFLHMFGKPNPKKNNRYAWSGACVPKFGAWNAFGQTLEITPEKDIVAYYSHAHDTRDATLLNPWLQTRPQIMIAVWKYDRMRKNIEDKFNDKGFFICKKSADVYHTICFGTPFNYDDFLAAVSNNKIIFDSGMYEGNTRNYSTFRSNANDFWNERITEEYE